MKWFFCWCQETDFRGDHNWKDLIRASVLSARANTTLEPNLIYDGEESDFVNELRGYGVKVIFHKISFLDDVIAHQPDNIGYQAIARGAFLRFEIPLHADDSDEFLLYTDADVLFLREPDFTGYAPEVFAAAPQFDRGSKSDLNSGVLLINNGGMKNIYHDLVKFTKENLSLGLDQEVLRVYLGLDYMMLPDHFNWKPYWGVNENATIIHWHGPKPEVVKQLEGGQLAETHDAWKPLLLRNPPSYAYYIKLYDHFISESERKCVAGNLATNTPGPRKDRRGFILQHINSDAKILEVGPSYNPLVPKSEGWNAVTVDHSNRIDLLKSYAQHNVNLDQIEDVDVVWNGSHLIECVGRHESGTFDVVVISHVLEHLPDPITFFASCRELLNNSGRILVAIPDKRYCFDFFQQITFSGDWIHAYYTQSVLHTPLTAYNSIAYAAKRGESIAWAADERAASIGFVHTLAEGMNAYRNSQAHPDTYIDFHTWRFLPSSIKMLFDELGYLELIDFHINNINTLGNEIIFELCPGPRRKRSEREIQDIRLTRLRDMYREMTQQFEEFLGSEKTRQDEFSLRRAHAHRNDAYRAHLSVRGRRGELGQGPLDGHEKNDNPPYRCEIQIRKDDQGEGSVILDLGEVLGVTSIEVIRKQNNEGEKWPTQDLKVSFGITQGRYQDFSQGITKNVGTEIGKTRVVFLLGIPVPAQYLRLTANGSSEDLLDEIEVFADRLSMLAPAV